MKEAFKSFGILLYFIFCQCIATYLIMIVKAYTDIDWLLTVNEFIENDKILTKDCFVLLWEVLYPAIIVADIIILIPMLIKVKKDKQKLFKKISFDETIIIITLSIVLNFIISVIVSAIPESFSKDYNDLMNLVVTDNFIMTLITTGILAPVVEEFIFRYAIIEIFSKKGEKIAIFVSTLMFGIAHFNPIQSTYAFVLGLLLGCLYIKERNLLKPLIMHLVINSTSVLYEYAPHWLQNIMIVIVVLCFGVFLYEILGKKQKI